MECWHSGGWRQVFPNWDDVSPYLKYISLQQLQYLEIATLKLEDDRYIQHSLDHLVLLNTSQAKYQDRLLSLSFLDHNRKIKPSCSSTSLPLPLSLWPAVLLRCPSSQQFLGTRRLTPLPVCMRPTSPLAERRRRATPWAVKRVAQITISARLSALSRPRFAAWHFLPTMTIGE